MEVKIGKNCWKILYNDTVSYELPRAKTPYKVTLNIVDYKQRIFCEHYFKTVDIFHKEYFYTFYRFDDLNKRIVKLFSEKFSNILELKPESGYILSLVRRYQSVYYISNDILCKFETEFDVCDVNKDYMIFWDKGLFSLYEIATKKMVQLKEDMSVHTLSEENVLRVIEPKVYGQLCTFYSAEDLMENKYNKLLTLEINLFVDEDGYTRVWNDTHWVGRDGKIQVVEPDKRIYFPLSQEYLLYLIDDSTPLVKDLKMVVISYLNKR